MDLVEEWADGIFLDGEAVLGLHEAMVKARAQSRLREQSAKEEAAKTTSGDAVELDAAVALDKPAAAVMREAAQDQKSSSK